jgi:hypothetical protein
VCAKVERAAVASGGNPSELPTRRKGALRGWTSPSTAACRYDISMHQACVLCVDGLGGRDTFASQLSLSSVVSRGGLGWGEEIDSNVVATDAWGEFGRSRCPRMRRPGQVGAAAGDAGATKVVGGGTRGGGRGRGSSPAHQVLRVAPRHGRPPHSRAGGGLETSCIHELLLMMMLHPVCCDILSHHVLCCVLRSCSFIFHTQS